MNSTGTDCKIYSRKAGASCHVDVTINNLEHLELVEHLEDAGHIIRLITVASLGVPP